MLLYAGKSSSNGATALANALGIKKIKHERSKYVPNANHVIINWGAANFPNRLKVAKVINTPEAIAEASNKLSFFQKLNGKGITPPFTTDRAEAIKMLLKGPVVCRTALNASGGRGIHIAEDASQIVNAPLYVAYKNKKQEFRIHIFRGKVIDMQEKARRHDVANPDWKIRNHDNGFIYKRQGIIVPQPVIDVAQQAFSNFSLDFGAFDVIWNEKNQKAYVLEVNTAPGLEGQTVRNYRDAFQSLL